jgi:hypothetical protein
MSAGDIINGPVYSVARFSTKYLNVPPSKHRLFNALGLMAGLYVGRQMMNIMVGETPDGEKVDKEDLIAPLKPLHGILAYEHYSDDPKMRWLRVTDQIIPGIIGGIGAVAGSYFFFREPSQKMTKEIMRLNPGDMTLRHAEQLMLFNQFKTLARVAGFNAIPGSASGLGLMPSALNYSTTLGSAFSIGAERNMAAGLPWLRELFNSPSSIPFRWHRLIEKKLIPQLIENPSRKPKELIQMLEGTFKQLANYITEEQVQKIADKVLLRRNKILDMGLAPAETQKKIAEEMKTMFSDLGMENLLLEIGVDPREVAVGDAGALTSIANWCSKILNPAAARKTAEIRKELLYSIEKRHPELKNKPFDPDRHLHTQTPARKAAAASLLGVAGASLGAVALSKDTEMSDLKGERSDKDLVTTTSTVGHKHHVHSKRNHGFVNGKLLDTAEGITGMVQAGIGSHRVHCAMGLMVGSWLGDKIMDALTGISFMGDKKIPKEDVWEPLQKFHGALKFNPHSDLPKDKWMQVLRWGVPGVLGALAVMQGSQIFFHKRHNEVKKAETLDEVEARATFAQSRPWGYTAAIASLFGSASGLQVLPFTNYATSLGTRYSLGAGRKVSLPVVGKLWSNNPTLFPYGPPGMINMLIKEAVNNKSFDPELLETEAIGILKPWFKNVTPAQIEAFVMEVHKVRDKFFKEGGVPEEFKKELETELSQHFKGAGLEQTLRDIGLDPSKAEIAQNGWSGAIANILGSKGAVNKIAKDYQASYRERLETSRKKAENQPEPTVSH